MDNVQITSNLIENQFFSAKNWSLDVKIDHLKKFLSATGIIGDAEIDEFFDKLSAGAASFTVPEPA